MLTGTAGLVSRRCGVMSLLAIALPLSGVTMAGTACYQQESSWTCSLGSNCNYEYLGRKRSDCSLSLGCAPTNPMQPELVQPSDKTSGANPGHKVVTYERRCSGCANMLTRRVRVRKNKHSKQWSMAMNNGGWGKYWE
jgi:hypothetical protein